MRTAAALLALAVHALPAPAAEPVRPKTVLILDSFGPDVASFHAAAAAFRTTLAQELGQPVDFHQVSLDAARFTDPGTEKAFANFLRDRFGARKVDLLVPIAAPAMSFLLEYRKQLFPNTPMLVTGAAPRRLPPGVPGPATYVVTQEIDLASPIENILRLLPGTKNILVVLGGSPLERFWMGEMRREYVRFAGRVELIYVDDLPLAQALERAAELPPQ